MSLIERIEGYFAKPAHWHHDNHTEAGALLREALAALKEARFDSYKAAQLNKCDEMLTASGVPQWIENEGMPGSATPERLKWFLNRRKDVSKTEAKQGIDAEIKLGMEHAKEWESAIERDLEK